MPAIRGYRFFPVTREWAKDNTWNYHTFYTRFQSAGLFTEAKRKVINQPVGTDAVIAVVKKKAGMLTKISDEVYTQSLSEQQDMSVGRSASFLLPSETSLFEFWARKPNRKTA